MAKTHALETIDVFQSKPITKAILSVVGSDAKQSARALVDNVMAQVKGQAKFWHSIMWQVIEGTPDFRAEVARLLDDRLSTMREQNRTEHGLEKNRDTGTWTKKNVDVYAVQASSVRTVAKAFNAGATIEALGEHYSIPDPRAIGYVQVVNFARAFLDAQGMADGRGRKTEALKVAITKFLARRSEQLKTDVDKVNYKRLVQFLETLQ